MMYKRIFICFTLFITFLAPLHAVKKNYKEQRRESKGELFKELSEALIESEIEPESISPLETSINQASFTYKGPLNLECFQKILKFWWLKKLNLEITEHQGAHLWHHFNAPSKGAHLFPRLEELTLKGGISAVPDIVWTFGRLKALTLSGNQLTRFEPNQNFFKRQQVQKGQKLKFLDLSYNDLECLPMNIHLLKGLNFFNLDCNDNLSITPSGANFLRRVADRGKRLEEEREKAAKKEAQRVLDQALAEAQAKQKRITAAKERSSKRSSLFKQFKTTLEDHGIRPERINSEITVIRKASLYYKGPMNLECLQALLKLFWLKRLNLEITEHRDLNLWESFRSPSAKVLFPFLERLKLKGDIEKAPSFIWHLPRLYALNLSGNNLSHFEPSKKYLKRQTHKERKIKLTILDLSDNDLKGLPHTITMLHGLEALILDGNKDLTLNEEQEVFLDQVRARAEKAATAEEKAAAKNKKPAGPRKKEKKQKRVRPQPAPEPVFEDSGSKRETVEKQRNSFANLGEVDLL